MMSELSSPEFEYMFFGLFELWDRCARAKIGSNVIQAVVDKNGKHPEGLPSLVRSQHSWVSRGWARRQRAEIRSSSVGRGAARDERLHDVFRRNG
ncbi:hypothetical protein H4582DRAFT_12549 [Lactarius indigo]|nr:hypothetical protein H4582DRAFT_12549 [Lactarius indigo]